MTIEAKTNRVKWTNFISALMAISSPKSFEKNDDGTITINTETDLKMNLNSRQDEAFWQKFCEVTKMNHDECKNRRTTLKQGRNKAYIRLQRECSFYNAEQLKSTFSDSIEVIEANTVIANINGEEKKVVRGDRLQYAGLKHNPDSEPTWQKLEKFIEAKAYSDIPHTLNVGRKAIPVTSEFNL